MANFEYDFNRVLQSNTESQRKKLDLAQQDADYRKMLAEAQQETNRLHYGPGGAVEKQIAGQENVANIGARTELEKTRMHEDVMRPYYGAGAKHAENAASELLATGRRAEDRYNTFERPKNVIDMGNYPQTAAEDLATSLARGSFVRRELYPPASPASAVTNPAAKKAPRPPWYTGRMVDEHYEWPTKATTGIGFKPFQFAVGLAEQPRRLLDYLGRSLWE